MPKPFGLISKVNSPERIIFSYIANSFAWSPKRFFWSAHRLTTTTASTADVRVMETLLHGAEREVYGDKGYVSEARRCAFKARGGRRWGVARRAKPGQPLSDADRERNRRLSSIRSKVEHVFRVVKRQFGYAKVRYRGLAKNTAQLFTLFALSNLYLARRQLVTAG